MKIKQMVNGKKLFQQETGTPVTEMGFSSIVTGSLWGTRETTLGDDLGHMPGVLDVLEQ